MNGLLPNLEACIVPESTRQKLSKIGGARLSGWFCLLVVLLVLSAEVAFVARRRPSDLQVIASDT